MNLLKKAASLSSAVMVVEFSRGDYDAKVPVINRLRHLLQPPLEALSVMIKPELTVKIMSRIVDI